MQGTLFQIMVIAGIVGVSFAGVAMGWKSSEREIRQFLPYAIGSPVLLLAACLQSRFFSTDIGAINTTVAFSVGVAVFTSWLSLFGGIVMVVRPDAVFRPRARAYGWCLIASAIATVVILFVFRG